MVCSDAWCGIRALNFYEIFCEEKGFGMKKSSRLVFVVSLVYMSNRLGLALKEQ